MAKGKSGRIVIEVDPNFKYRLHSLLALRGITLKDWFTDTALEYLGDFGILENSTSVANKNSNSLTEKED